MTISEYIAKMQAMMEQHGDLLCVSDSDLGYQVANEPYPVEIGRDDHAHFHGGHAVGTLALVIG